MVSSYSEPDPLAAEQGLLEALSAPERRALGCYLTPPPIAGLMAALIAPYVESRAEEGGAVVIDPAAGTGRLLRAVGRRLDSARQPSVPAAAVRLVGVERQPELASWAAGQLAAADLVEADALDLLDARNRFELLGFEEVDAVIANPPYVREKHHRAVLAQAVERNPSWSRFRAPRGDLQQLFLALGVELLRPGGQLVYLVCSYWLQSDSARPLREHLEANVDVLNVVDFGQTTLFRDAPGQHSLLLHARRRPRSAAAPTSPKPVFASVTGSAPSDLGALAEGLSRALLEGAEVDWLCVERERALVVAGPTHRWYLPSARDAALAALERGVARLGDRFETHQGVVSGADVVTKRNRVWLPDPPPLGTGIFILSSAEVDALGLSADEHELLKRVYRARDIRPFAVDLQDDDAASWLLDLRDGVDFEACPAIARHLARFRPILERRREVKRGRMPWWRLHWPRDPSLFRRPRIVTPRRSAEPRFAMAPEGTCEQSDIALITHPEDDESELLALLDLLNSSEAALWFQHRGKHKGPIREYFGAPLEELPLFE